MVTALIFSEFC